MPLLEQFLFGRQHQGRVAGLRSLVGIGSPAEKQGRQAEAVRTVDGGRYCPMKGCISCGVTSVDICALV